MLISYDYFFYFVFSLKNQSLFYAKVLLFYLLIFLVIHTGQF